MNAKRHYHVDGCIELFTTREAAKEEARRVWVGGVQAQVSDPCYGLHFAGSVRSARAAIDHAMTKAQHQLDEGWQAAPEEWGQTGWQYDQLLHMLRQAVRDVEAMRSHTHRYVTTDDERRIFCTVCGRDGDT
jgi:hypothetical protein